VIEKFCDDVPTVIFDSFVPDVGLGFVGSDNAQFPRLIVEYLCRTGEPPSFLEMKTPANPNANRRRNGYIEAMERLGHEPQVVKVEGEGWHFEEIGRREGGKALAAGLFESDTILCSNDRLAIGFLTACYEQNIRVGRDSDCEIRVAGQDDHPFARFTCPPLTTIAQDYDAISRSAVETLFKAVEGAEKKHETTLFEGKLIMRDSA
jgi:DNA-binding LacI/PurR family transcriptional regulator